MAMWILALGVVWITAAVLTGLILGKFIEVGR